MPNTSTSAFVRVIYDSEESYTRVFSSFEEGKKFADNLAESDREVVDVQVICGSWRYKAPAAYRNFTYWREERSNHSRW